MTAKGQKKAAADFAARGIGRMKNKLLLFLVFSFAWASGAVVTESELAVLYDETNMQDYAEHRDCIAATEANRQILVRLSADHTISWHVSLMANICLERMEKAEEQDRFEGYDWNSDPEYDPDWICSAAGYPKELIPLFHKRLVESGLWYRYLEHYLGKIPTDSGIMRHVGNVLLEDSVEAPRHFAALIANEHAKTDLAEPISWRPDALSHLKSYILDGTLPEGILTILPYAPAYFSLEADERAKAVESIRDPVLVEHWFEFYRANGRYDSALHKRLESLRKESEGVASPVEQEDPKTGVPLNEGQFAGSNPDLEIPVSVARPCSSGTIDPVELGLVWKMSGEDYLAKRDQMVSRLRGETTELIRICGDSSVPWEARVMAGVCRSRMDHAGELDAFLGQDWKQDREFDTSWIPMITGFPLELDALVQKRMMEADHWYLYLELFAGKYDLSGSLRPFRAVDGLMEKCPRPEIRYLSARICEDIVQKSYARSRNIAGFHAGLLRNFVEDGTYPDGAKTLILDLKPNCRYSSSHVLPLIQALSSVSELTKLKERLNLPRDIAFIDDRIRELQNSEPTNRLPVSQILTAEDAPGSKTATPPDP